MSKKCIVLCGGNGTRLNPLTITTSKQLLPVYDKPMVYYPLSTVVKMGFDDIAIVCKSQDRNQFESLLKDGSQWGIKISYWIQDIPKGIADAFLVCEDFIKGESCGLILGDNIFHSETLCDDFVNKSLSDTITRTYQNTFAHIFGCEVKDPERYGVAVFRDGVFVGIEEKPTVPKSNVAITGLYIYPPGVVDRVKNMQPSKRGELEITDLNNTYINDNKIFLHKLSNGSAWLDTGTFDSLLDAANYVKVLSDRCNITIGDIVKSI